MAILKPGQVGDFNGKIGQVVVTKWRQLTVGRSTPKKSTKKASIEQTDHRSKFSLVMNLMSRLGSTISVGYQNSSGNLTPMNVAMKYHMAEAITGVYPDYTIDYSAVVLTQPRMNNEIDWVDSYAVNAAVDSKVTIAWALDKYPNAASKPTDLLYVVFYNVSKKRFMTYDGVAERSLLTTSLRVPQISDTDIIHGWAFFVSPNKKFVSRSEYLGVMNLKAV